MNATHIRCGSIHDYLASLWRSISMNCAKTKKNDATILNEPALPFFCSFFPQMCIRREKKKQIKIITSQPHYKLLDIFLGRMSFICAAAVLPLLPVVLTFSLSMHSMKYYHINAIQNWKNYVINNAANEI